MRPGTAEMYKVNTRYFLSPHHSRRLYDVKGSYTQTGTLRSPHGDEPLFAHASMMTTAAAAQVGVSTPTRRPPGRHTVLRGVYHAERAGRAGG
eukprot:6205579-Pleurochrysis_carterae.AAC.2